MKIIDEQLINGLAEDAKNSPRQRKNLNFHQGMEPSVLMECKEGPFVEHEVDGIQETKPTKDIYLAGGCFWGTEHYFKQIEGVVITEVGFANGHTENPTYKEVYTDQTGFAETVFVRFYPDVVSLEFLLRMFFKAIDPTSLNKQGHDEGTRYRTGVYYTDPEDLPVIEKVFAEEQKNYNQPLAVEKLPLQNFYTAEEYHDTAICPCHYLNLQGKPKRNSCFCNNGLFVVACHKHSAQQRNQQSYN